MVFVYFAEQAGRAWVVYRRAESSSGFPPEPIDFFRRKASAEHAVNLLNQGAATVEVHRPLECRVQPLTASVPRATW